MRGKGGGEGEGGKEDCRKALKGDWEVLEGSACLFVEHETSPSPLTRLCSLPADEKGENCVRPGHTWFWGGWGWGWERKEREKEGGRVV